MDHKGITIGKKLLKTLFNSLEKFLNIEDDLSEEEEEEYNQDFLNIKDEVSLEISNKKKEKKLETPLRKSKRNVKTPIRYGYDE